MRYTSGIGPLAIASLLSGVSGAAISQTPIAVTEAASSDALETGFQTPPNSARPRVWWHWMNGNVTKDGIRKDLEWIHRIGIGGVQNFDAALETPKIVDNRLVYMSPEWKDAFRYATVLSEQLGLEMAIASSPGWSQTGGPWVKPTDAMKKLVWSETELAGGRRFRGKLTPLPAVTGPFQDLPLADAIQTSHAGPLPMDQGQIAVLAVPAQDEKETAQARFTSADGAVLNAAVLTDDSLQTVVDAVKGTAAKPGFVTIEYPHARTVRSITLSMPGSAAMFMGTDLAPRLDVARDDGGWIKVADIPPRPVPTTLSFPAVSGKRFRVTFLPFQGDSFSLGKPVPGAVIGGFPSPFSGDKVKIAELKLSGEARVNDFEVKAGFFLADDYYALDKIRGDDLGGVSPRSVIDLTRYMQPDGTLDWVAPAGRWKVLRLGYSLIGKMNHPAIAEATGLEADKYDGDAVRRYMQTYLGMYRETVGAENMGRKGLRAILNDSIETGAANWTPKMFEQFQQLRGYDPRPWLPALTGTIVGTRSQSDAFLYDYRRTLSDLISSEHYGTIAKVAHEAGMTVYGEALEAYRPGFGDDMAMRSHADVPMAALWTFGKEGPRSTSLADMKGASSIAHLTGKTFVAAESLTAAFAPWAFAPRDLKPVIDLEFAMGINRPVIHTSVHQPVDDKVPGLSLSIFGQYFNRHESWAEMARPWVDYMARSSFLLQQGRNIADVAYFYGEEGPLTALYVNGMPANAPRQFAYDFINADSLLNLLQTKEGELRTSGGARYKALYLGGSSQRMTLATLRRIGALVEAGATVVGAAPQSSPALQDDTTEFDALVKRLWSGGSVTTVGTGQVIASGDVEAALKTQGVLPDFSYSQAGAGASILFLHRQSDNADIYFLNNRRDRAEHIEARFRIIGKVPEIWRADAASAEPLTYHVKNGHTIIPLDLLPQDAYFIVFRTATDTLSRTVPARSWKMAADLSGGPWDIGFQPDRGAPAQARLDTLNSLSDNVQPGIRYFSGVASYTKTFGLPKEAKPRTPLLLDLGNIGDIAEVRVNGRLAGTVWKAPYQINIGAFVTGGRNQLEVRVADLWVNRLIGDAQPDVVNKITYTTFPTYRADAPLRPSGLLGPVRLLQPK